MKKVAMVAIFVLVSTLLFAEVTENPDKPSRGTWDFALEKEWELDSAGEEILAAVGTLRVDEKGDIYALDGRRSRIHVFNPRGDHLASMGSPGEGPGELQYPHMLFPLGAEILVLDNRRISYFSKKGKFLRSINPKKMYMPYVLLDADRIVGTSFMAAVREEDRDIEIYDYREGKGIKIAQAPPFKALKYSGTGGNIALRIEGMQPDLVMGFDGKYLYYGMSDRYLLHKIDLSGSELLSFSINGRKPRGIPAKARRKAIKDLMGRSAMEMPTKVIDALAGQIPDHFPFFNGIHIDKQGGIYVLSRVFGDDTTRKMDIFSPRGEFLYHGETRLPGGFSFFTGPEFFEDNFYAVVEDEEGERMLVKYKIRIPGIK